MDCFRHNESEFFFKLNKETYATTRCRYTVTTVNQYSGPVKILFIVYHNSSHKQINS